MAGRLAIGRVRLVGLAPRDHPDPRSLKIRLAEATRLALAPALGRALADWSGPEVLRVRRLEVDIAMDAAFDPDLFAALLAHAIASALRRAGGEGVVAFPTRAAYLGAFVEALAAGRARQCWWTEAEGLHALPTGAAIRTALAANASIGLAALAGLPPLRLAVVLEALGPSEADRLLDEFSAAGSVTGKTEAGGITGTEATIAASIAAIAKASSAGAGLSPLALYIRAVALNENAEGPSLAAAARVWAALATGLAGRTEVAAAAFLETLAGDGIIAELGTAPTLPGEARRALAHHLAGRRSDTPVESEMVPECRFTRFGGLFLLLPTLGFAEIEETLAGWPGTPDPGAAALISHAALGLCAGRVRFAEWLADPLWRELFGLPLHDPPRALAEWLSAIHGGGWDTLEGFLPTLASTRDARFLLPPSTRVRSRPARRALARLASAILSRFARRLVGFSASSAPFLWQNLLAVPAAVERVGGSWHARLGRPSLDVLLSLSRLAEGTVSLPSGATVRLTRASP